MYFGAAKVSTSHPLGRDRMCVQQWAMASKYEEILPVTSHSQNHKTSATYFYILWPQDDLDIDHCRLIILIWPASSGNELTKPSTPLYFMLEQPETALFCKCLNCRAWLRLKWAHWQWASKMPGRGQFADLAILDHKALNSHGQCHNVHVKTLTLQATAIPQLKSRAHRSKSAIGPSWSRHSCFPVLFLDNGCGSLNSSRCRVSVTLFFTFFFLFFYYFFIHIFIFS